MEFEYWVTHGARPEDLGTSSYHPWIADVPVIGAPFMAGAQARTQIDAGDYTGATDTLLRFAGSQAPGIAVGYGLGKLASSMSGGSAAAADAASVLRLQETAEVAATPQRILLVGAETEGEFAYANQMRAAGNDVTVVNPRVSPAAESYISDGGNFVKGRIEDLHPSSTFDLIREDYPFPTGEHFQLASDFIDSRVGRLNPGGRWFVTTESGEFASTVEGVSQFKGLDTMKFDLPAFHEGTPVPGGQWLSMDATDAARPFVSTRFALITEAGEAEAAGADAGTPARGGMVRPGIVADTPMSDGSIARMNSALTNRMLSLGIPKQNIGIPYDGAGTAFYPGGNTIGGNVPGLGINVDSGILGRIEGWDMWNDSGLNVRADAVIAHEWSEFGGLTHEQALVATPNTSLPISAAARALAADMLRLFGASGGTK
jgi:hypothetical protein